MVYGAAPTAEASESAESAEVPAEIQDQRDLTSARTLATLTPNEIKDMPEEQKEVLRENFVKALQTATSAEARTRIYARYMDLYQVDNAIGFVLPLLGDAGASVVSGIYLETEAELAGLSRGAQLRIAGYQVADATLGAIFPPGTDLFVDGICVANILGQLEFRSHVKKLGENAKAAGVPEEAIQEMLDDADALVEKFDLIAKAWARIKGKSTTDRQKLLEQIDKKQVKKSGKQE